MGVDLAAAVQTFDIGMGPMTPDEEIIKTGKVPVSAYTSDERFDREMEVYRKIWLNVAVDSELPHPGDWVVREVEACKASIIVVRGQDDVIRAFHNVCSHRALKLVWGEKGCSKRFVCPYHGWSYGDDGRLRAFPDPESFPDLDRAASGLTPVATEVWKGLVFVNFDPAPRQTLREFLGKVVDKLEHAPLDKFRYTARLTGTIKSNWKAGADGTTEANHVPWLHGVSVSDMICPADNPHAHFMFFEALDAHNRTSNPHNPDYALPPHKVVQQRIYAKAPQVVVSDGAKASFDVPGINPTQHPNWGNDLFAIFPNFFLALAHNGFFSMHYWPVTLDTHRWEAHWHFERGPRTWSERWALEGTLAYNRDIATEDTACVERQQKAMESGAKAFIQFGLYELVARHKAAVLAAAVGERQGAALAHAAE